MSDKNDDLGRHIGTLWKTAMSGWGTMREVVTRSTQTGRLRIDIALLARERPQVVRRPEDLDLGGMPGARERYARKEERQLGRHREGSSAGKASDFQAGTRLRPHKKKRGKPGLPLQTARPVCGTTWAA